jgi:cell surface protein SprA
VQSNWQDSVIFDNDSLVSSTKFVVAEMSEDINTDFEPPPGVEAYTDPTTNVTEAQRALQMKFEDLQAGDTCLATKDLLSVDRYSGYRSLEMFVYGLYDDPADEGKIQFFFRIGQDHENYYEYYTNIYEGWDTEQNRNSIKFNFDEITALKDQAQSELESGTEIDFDDGVQYRIFGTPDINKIRFFAAGLVNTDTTKTISGQLWLDELRVSDVRRDVGTAGRIQVQGNIADLMSYNFSYESRDPYFRGLSTSTRGGSTNNLGSGQTNTTYNYGMTFNVQKFLPRSWGAQMPVSLRYTKTTQTPLLRTNSDVVLPEERRKEEQSIREARSMSVTAKFNRKGKNPLFNLLLNRLKTSFSYSRSDAQTPTTPYTFGENYSVRSSFDFSIETVPSVPVFFWTKPVPLLKKLAGSRMAVYPDKWTTSADYRRNLSITDDINLVRRSSNKKTFDGRMDIRYRMFNNLNMSFGYSTKRDLSDRSLVNIAFKDFKLGLETNYAQNFNASYDPRLFDFWRASFSYKVTYTDDWQRSYRARRSNLSRSRGVSGEFNHQTLIGKKKKTTRRRPPTRKGDTPTEEDKRPFYEPVVDAIRLFTSWIDPFSYSYSESYNNSLPGMKERPGWGYRLGLKDEAEVDNVPDAIGSRSAQEGQRYEVSSGFTLLGGLVTKVKYARSTSEDIFKQGTRNRNTSTSWPDLSLRIQQFKQFPLFKDYLNKFIQIFSPRTGFTRQSRESFNLDDGFPLSKSESTNHRPLLSVTFRAFRSLSLSAAYSVDMDEKELFNPTTGSSQSITKSIKKSMALTAKYSFTSPKGISLPIFGRVKFTSTVDLEMTVRFNSNISETKQAGGDFATTVDKSDFMFSPVISYTFSRQMKGGLTMRWQDSNDNYRSRKSHTREVQIWTEISF